MARGLLASTLILLLNASAVAAEYTEFFWPNATSQKCPGMKYTCIPPSICALSEPMKVHYCCVPGNADQVCHTSSPGCDGGGSGKPSSAQIPCSSGANAFCCFKDSQQCTQGFNQINICWATAKNPVAMFDDEMMNRTYKSLQAAKPSAASYSIALADLQSMTSTTPSASRVSSSATSSATSSAISSASSSTSATSAASDSSSGGISGGAIGGIVGGVVGGLLLLGAIAFFLWRRRRNASIAYAVPTCPPHEQQHEMGYEPQVAEMQNTSATPTEKYARNGYTPEMSAHQAPVEMSADPPRRY